MSAHYLCFEKKSSKLICAIVNPTFLYIQLSGIYKGIDFMDLLTQS